MAKKLFLLKYQDGSKKHIGCAERDSLLLDRLIRQIDEREYAFIGQAKTFHSFADLEQLKTTLSQPTILKRKYLAGTFIWQHKGRNMSERLETPEAMGLRFA